MPRVTGGRRASSRSSPKAPKPHGLGAVGAVASAGPDVREEADHAVHSGVGFDHDSAHLTFGQQEAV